MKKLLLTMLALCMVISVVLVACEDHEQPDGETTDVTTEAPTTEDVTTEPGETSTEDVTTEPDESSSEDTTTEPGESSSEETTEPPVEPIKVITHLSFDELRKMVNGEDSGEGIFAPGASDGWDGIAAIDHTISGLKFWGWVGFTAETVGEFGYQIGDAEPVYSASFAVEAEGPVVDAAAGSGAKCASRLAIVIPTADLGAGDVTVKALVKDAEGNVEILKEFTISKTLPFVEKEAAGMKAWSFDTFYLNDAMYFEVDGGAADKLAAQDNIVTIAYGQDHFNVKFRGWVGFDQAIESFGYYVGNKYEFVYDAEFTKDTEDGVKAAGGEFASRFEIQAPIAELGYGAHKVGAVVKLADGTVARLYEITVVIENLVVDTEGKLVTSIDHVNKQGPINEDGSYAPNFAGVGGVSKGVIDAATAGVTTDKSGNLSIGGWLGIDGGVNRYVYSIDGVNWYDVLSGGKDGEPLEGHFAAAGGITDGLKNGMFNGEAMIQINLAEYEGATGTVYFGAIPEQAQNTVIVFCEIQNITVAPVVDTVWYDGTNGTLSVPANFETKFVIRNAADMTIKIENSYNFVVTATNLYTGQSVVLQADMLGTIEQAVPSDWGMIELTIANVTAEAAEITVQVLEPVAQDGGLVLGTNEIEVTVSGYWCAGVEATFTAAEAGTYTFTLTDDTDSASLSYMEAPYYGMVDMPFSIVLEEGQSIMLIVATDLYCSPSADHNGEGAVTVDLLVEKTA